MNIQNLKNILFKKLDLYRDKLTDNEISLDLLNEILIKFKQGYLIKEGHDYLEEKYQFNVTKYNLDTAIMTIENDLFILEYQHKKLSDYYNKIRLVINALGYKQVISSDLRDFIKELLEEEKINNVDLINIMERIKIHNSNCYDSEYKIKGSDLYLIINMVNGGYEKIVIPDNVNKDSLIEISKKTINLIDSNNIETIKEVNLVDKYKNTNDLIFIYTYILKHYQEEIYNLVEILKEKEFYFDIKTLEDIKNEYKSLYQKYMWVREKLDIIKTKPLEDKITINDLEVSENNLEYKLYYASNYKEPDKCYLMKDLENMRKEALNEVAELLNNFKMGITNRVKILSTDNFLELKSDQIRIILKPLGSNNYAVMGAFIKKSDNDRLAYQNIMARPMPELDLEYSEAVEEYYQNYIRENARKGSR